MQQSNYYLVYLLQELAVINRSRRQATVSTGALTELLCISAKVSDTLSNSIHSEKIEVSNNHTLLQSEPKSHDNQIQIQRGHVVSIASSYFPIGGNSSEY